MLLHAIGAFSPPFPPDTEATMLLQTAVWGRGCFTDGGHWAFAGGGCWGGQARGNVLLGREIKIVDWKLSRVCMVLVVHCGARVCRQQFMDSIVVGRGGDGPQVPYGHGILSTTVWEKGREHP